MKFFQKLFANSPSNASSGSPLPAAPFVGHGGILASSATPLTDLEVGKILQTGQVQKVSAEFARQLERKLYEYQRNNGQHTLANGKASG
jgi:hypothetical protein